MANKIDIKKDPVNPESDQLIAAHIIEISRAMQKLAQGPLKQKTIVLLVHDDTKIPKRDIQKILDSLHSLESTYLRPQK